MLIIREKHYPIPYTKEQITKILSYGKPSYAYPLISKKVEDYINTLTKNGKS